MSKKKWTESEISYMKRFAASKRVGELAQRFDADPKEVRAKLAALGLAAKDAAAAAEAAADPLLETFETGLKALHAGDWAEAEKRFQEVIDASDMLDLTCRARQYLAVCRSRQAEDSARPEDPFLEAVFLRNRGDLDAALELCDGKSRSEDERFVYLAAAIHALAGRTGKAAETLARAIELNPKNRVHAFHDPDFAEFRKDPEHASLLGLG